MSLELYFHPLSSFCQKVLVAFYENGTPFEGHVVDLGDETQRTNFRKLWPIGKFPVLRDTSAGLTIPESSVIIEYLDQHYPGLTRFLPQDPDAARQARFRDRFYDLYVQLPMQKIVIDRLRPPGQGDSLGVEQALGQLATALDIIEKDMGAKTWAMGEAFTMAECAAAPALYYANLVMPFEASHKNVSAYYARLMARPSFARAVAEAAPYRAQFPDQTA